jgi:hypothetical protein
VTLKLLERCKYFALTLFVIRTRSFELLNKAFAQQRDDYQCEYNDGNVNDVECELVCEHNEQFWNERINRRTGYKSRIIGGKVDS